MKDKNALFLLQAIGELSENTVAEAKRPAVYRFRYIAAAVAAVMVAAFMIASVVMMNTPDKPEQMVSIDQKGSASAYLDKPATPDQIGETATQPPTEAPTEEPTEAAEYDDGDDNKNSDVYDDGPKEEDQNERNDSLSGEYLSGTIRMMRGTVGDACEIGGQLYSAWWCDSGWRDYHTVALITSQAQLDQFFMDYTGDTQKGFSFRDIEAEYDWENYGMIAVANTREDNMVLDLTELRRDESSASFYPYFRESAVISNEPLSNITDIKLYRIRLSDCEGITGFYL